MPPSTCQEDPLAELRARFAARTQERLAAILDLVAGWRAGTANAQLDELRREAHQLAGSAGTFGFAALAEAAASLEAVAEQDDPPFDTIQPLLTVLTAQANRLVAAVPASRRRERDRVAT
ncbi:MAG: Hpt domain-containing protein [Geminicoccaceae bacterium]|jgi:HPt (histidine-containing phosphotransfer) domain-containing protein|nr:Hpt domain-containing protein [Geminicoccaceae bacterium]MCP5230613.1 Hpt domain-containing protein [Zoogloeaceae bacterium]